MLSQDDIDDKGKPISCAVVITWVIVVALIIAAFYKYKG